MRVAIEAASLTPSSGGLARYTAELGLALAGAFPEDEFSSLVSDQKFPLASQACDRALPANLKRGGGPRNGMERRWWTWGLNCELERLGADLGAWTGFRRPLHTAPPECRHAARSLSLD